ELPAEISGAGKAPGARGAGRPAARAGGEAPLKERVARAVSRIEKEEILRALERADGSRGEAARLLGISRRTLFYKLKEHGI
ncbi:MAG: helix-turn-helix domain-containing protein, partial [bacterium]